jgi:hypothetical protein
MSSFFGLAPQTASGRGLLSESQASNERDREIKLEERALRDATFGNISLL